jgi:hypothetical protein
VFRLLGNHRRRLDTGRSCANQAHALVGTEDGTIPQIRFWREETKFEMLRGDARAIERSSVGAQFERLKNASSPA